MTTDIVPADNMAAVEALDPESRALAVTNMLTEARAWLAHAVEATDPSSIAVFKAQMATMAEATKQLGLSKDIQTDALEMVRRAERGVGVAIRKGQAEGTVRRRGQVAVRANQYGQAGKSVDNRISSPTDFVPADDLTGNGAGIYDLTDGVTDEQFETAVSEAKTEGNLSRANVVRKVKQITGPETRQQRADLIQDLAGQGYSSRQMPIKVGVTEETVRKIAREFSIEIPGDKAVGRTRRHDSNRIATETVSALEGLAMGVGLIVYDDLDAKEISHWATSLDDSLRALNRFRKQLKEM